MDRILIESSSDEDDTYTNSVARLKALKKQRLETEKPVVPISIIVPDDTETVSYIRTRSRTSARLNKKKHLLINNYESDKKNVSKDEEPILVSEPYKNDVIALSSDDALSENEDNYEMTIKVHWRSSRIDRLSIHRNDNFKKIFQHYADLEKVSLNEILIMRKEKIINYMDTPASLKLSVIDILDGGIVNPDMNMIKDTKDADICTIKIQTVNKKQSLIIPLKRDQKFKALFTSCAEQLAVNESKMKFYFDGEQIDPSDSPDTLDLEGEACIDLHVSST